MKMNLKLKLFYYMLILEFTQRIYSHHECGFEKHKMKDFHKFEENEHSLRFLQDQPYEQIRISIDYTTLQNQKSVTEELFKNIQNILETAITVHESLIKVKRLNQLLVVTDCHPSITISTDISTTGISADLVIFPFFDEGIAGTATQAYASTCVINSRNSRPIAGLIAFTPSLNYNKTNWFEYYTTIAIHELTHVLGFNTDVFDTFIDENQQPVPLNKTLQETVINGVNRKIIVSPKALDAARRHFNCSDLIGIELENQGGIGTIGSHWESRIMLSDYMIGFTYDETTLSEITLAFLEDTGWYQTNYYTGGLFRYGKNAGCSVIMNKCITDGFVLHPNEFCNVSNAPVCSAGKLSKGFCYIANYPQAIDHNYQYFPQSTEGGIIFPDYCPVSNSPTISNYFHYWNCANGLSTEYSANLGEEISPESACFMSSLISKGSDSSSTPKQPICYKYDCNFEAFKYNVTIGNNIFQCPGHAALLEVEDYDGTFSCPAFDEICTSQTRCTSLIDCVLKKALPASNINITYIPDSTDITPTTTTDAKTGLLFMPILFMLVLIL